MEPLSDADLLELKELPRPVYGHARSIPNRVIAHRHSHPWTQLSYALKGVIEVTTAGGRFVAPPQRAVWIPAGLPHRVACSPATQISSLYIESDALPRATAECRVLGVGPLLRELIRSFRKLPVLYDEAGADGRLAQVLLDQLACAPDTGLMLPLPSDPRLRKVCAALQAHPHKQEALKQWAARLEVSEKTLGRLFFQETGMGFRQWRQRMRLLGSLPYLERGDRVTDVALACGYKSTSAFIAAFREHMGGTPGDFMPRVAGGAQRHWG
jgi:AraC-like DNA-binding protein